ncbi:hypothetical protein FRB94_001975 [Tulasnella sp. JGI-2019a]|nr:hypothetical protein FRB93_010075 [Tulasnella sp. JGI-2019a]KAG9004937.1 hypothetical protein FRB94_001975 [Tulasnella sp. JGI-2019a]KAG9030150.1 hypothetical protein FRB95_004288 [Tulasnella sp. JGI-2019a]
MQPADLIAILHSRTGLHVERVKAVLRALVIGPSDKSLLPFIPRPIKLLVAFVFLLNWRSWPLVWHAKVFMPTLRVRLNAFFKARSLQNKRKFLGEISCVGADPFEVVSTIKRYASVDDIGGYHLSNSVYFKVCDFSRGKAFLDLFPAVLGDGAWIAVGATNCTYIHEISPGAYYDVKTTIGGWDEKWLYIVYHFITYPSKSSKSSKPSSTNKPLYKAPGTIPKSKIKSPLPEGAVLNCVITSACCFKFGRITVPPQVALIACGFGDPSKRRWFHVQELRYSKNYPPASTKPPVIKNKMQDIMRGGWKTAHVEDWPTNPHTGVNTFWELGEYEERRAHNVKEIFGPVHSGMKHLREKGY